MSKIVTILKTTVSLPLRIFSHISPIAIIRNSKIDKKAVILSFCKVYNSEIEKYTYLGRTTNVYNTTIGKYTSIADGCIIGAAKHPLDHVSTSPVFYSKKNIFNKCFAVCEFDDYSNTHIGNDVWIGTHAFIKGGVKIGDGAVIGAYSVVTKDVEPYTIVAGNPAKVIRMRFNQVIVNELLNCKWWNWSEDKIETNAKTFLSIDAFINSNYQN